MSRQLCGADLFESNFGEAALRISEAPYLSGHGVDGGGLSSVLSRLSCVDDRTGLGGSRDGRSGVAKPYDEYTRT